MQCRRCARRPALEAICLQRAPRESHGHFRRAHSQTRADRDAQPRPGRLDREIMQQRAFSSRGASTSAPSRPEGSNQRHAPASGGAATAGRRDALLAVLSGAALLAAAPQAAAAAAAPDFACRGERGYGLQQVKHVGPQPPLACSGARWCCAGKPLAVSIRSILLHHIHSHLLDLELVPTVAASPLPLRV